MAKGVSLVDGDRVGVALSGIHRDTRGASRGVEGENSLIGEVGGRDGERLEHDLGHLLAVGLWVKGGLGQEDGMLLRGQPELVVEGVVPKLLDVVPVDTHGTPVLTSTL